MIVNPFISFQNGVDPIQALFEGYTEGAWYDPQDASTLWQDTARTIPVTATGQAVYAMDDKSGNNFHLQCSVQDGAPLYNVTGGGYAYLEFDGINDRLSSNTKLGFSTDPTISSSVVTETITHVSPADRYWQLGAPTLGIIAFGNGSDGWAIRYNNGNRIYNADNGVGVVRRTSVFRAAGANYGGSEFAINGVVKTPTSEANPEYTQVNVTDEFTLGLGTNNNPEEDNGNFRFYGGFWTARTQNDALVSAASQQLSTMTGL
jgi:hypothetical protein